MHKITKKTSVVLGLCLASQFASADRATWYDDTYKYNDYTWATDPGIWHDEAGRAATEWVADDEYVVRTGIYCNNSTFGGGVLHIGCEGALNPFVTINNGGLTSNRGVVFEKGFINLNHYHAPTVAETHSIVGPVTVLSSADSPFRLYSIYDNDTLILMDRIDGADDTGLRLDGNGKTMDKFAVMDASGFAGTFFVTSSVENSGDIFGAKLSLASGTYPSKVDMGAGTVLASQDKGAVTLGGMTLHTGSRILLTGDSTTHGRFTSTGSVTVETGVEIVLDWPIGADTEKLIVLTAPVDKADFVKDSFIFDAASVRGNPNGHLDVERSDELQSLVIVFDKTVTMTASFPNEWDTTKTEESSLTEPSHWSDLAVPHDGARYVAASKWIRTTTDWDAPYVFPGLSFSMTGGGWLFYRNEVSIPELSVSNSELMFVNVGADKKRFSVNRFEIAAGSYAAIGNYNGRILEMDVGLAGAGMLWLRGASRDNTLVPYGRYSLLRASEDYVGTICVSQYLASTRDDWHQLDFDTKFQTLYIANDYALGGKLPELNPAALTLANFARLEVVSNVLLRASLNRGITISGCGRFFVDDGIEFRCDWPITLDGDLYKEGPGRLALGGDANCRGGSNFYVSAGTIMPRRYDCCDGMKVAFAENTGLVIPIDPTNADLTRWGLYNAKVGGRITADDKINVTFDLTACPEPPSDELLVGILTVPAAAATEIRGRLAVQRRTYEHFGCKVEEIADAERGVVTFAANIKRSGFAIMIR